VKFLRTKIKIKTIAAFFKARIEGAKIYTGVRKNVATRGEKGSI